MTGNPSGSKSPATERLGDVSLVFLVALSALTLDLYLPALPALQADLHTTAAVAQLSLTVTTVGLAVGQLLVGPWTDAAGRRMPLVASILVHVLASTGVVLAPDALSLLACRFLQGVGAAGAGVVAVAVVRDRYTGPPFVRALARRSLVANAAPIVAPTLGSQLLGLGNWRWLFGCVAVYGLCGLVLAALFVPETLARSRRVPYAGLVMTVKRYGELLHDRAFTSAALIGGLVVSGVFAYMTCASFLLQRVYGFDVRGYGLVSAVNAVAFLLGNQTGSRILLRCSPSRLLQASLPLLAFAGFGVAVTVGSAGGPVGIVVPACLFMCFAGLSVPALPVLALRHNGHRAGTAAALLGAINFGFAGLLSPLVGLMDADSAVPVGVVMGLTGVAAAAVLHWLQIPAAAGDGISTKETSALRPVN